MIDFPSQIGVEIWIVVVFMLYLSKVEIAITVSFLTHHCDKVTLPSFGKTKGQLYMEFLFMILGSFEQSSDMVKPSDETLKQG